MQTGRFLHILVEILVKRYYNIFKNNHLQIYYSKDLLQEFEGVIM